MTPWMLMKDETHASFICWYTFSFGHALMVTLRSLTSRPLTLTHWPPHDVRHGYSVSPTPIFVCFIVDYSHYSILLCILSLCVSNFIVHILNLVVSPFVCYIVDIDHVKMYVLHNINKLLSVVNLLIGFTHSLSKWNIRLSNWQLTNWH